MLTLTLLTGVACGGSEEPTAGSTPAIGEPQTQPQPAATQTQPEEGPVPAPASSESCGDPATLMSLDETVNDEVSDDPVFYCVEVPSGMAKVVFALTDLAADVDLFVAFDTFEELSGGVSLRFSDNPGAEDESVTVEPSAYRGELLGFEEYADVTPGPYWIEVNGAATAFTLTVTGTPV